MPVLEHLQPNRVFYYFEEITKIPHGSYDTAHIADYLIRFAREHELNYYHDDDNNVIIYKNASIGYEDAKTVILQGHTDMVCEKTADSAHDFMKDPIQLQMDGDRIYAKDTTLGGDNGIAIAYALALLESEDIPHPAIEAVFTADEEVGLLGADALDMSQLSGTCMINLDSEDEGVITAGCAGGMTVTSSIPIHYWEADGLLVQVVIDGLIGGHSGVDADKNRGNANILMGRFLQELAENTDYMIRNIQGGGKDNAIPRRNQCELVISDQDIKKVMIYGQEFQEMIRSEYNGSDEEITISIIPKHSGTYQVLDMSSKLRVLFFLRFVPNGIIKMDGQIPGLVETSANPGIVRMTENSFVCTVGVRSSISSGRKDTGNRICFLTEFLGGEYEEQGIYPSWEFRPQSGLRTLMMDVYQSMYQKEMKVEIIHAGLECGIFYEKLKDLDCVSIGPDMKDVHTTEESLSISSVKRTWEFLLRVLKEMKE